MASSENSAIFICQTVYNFSLYHLTTEEEKALYFGLNEHIPTGLNHNKLFTEFEIFYQNILNGLKLHFFDLFILLKNIRSYIKDFYKTKNCIKKICKKSFEKKWYRILQTHRKAWCVPLIYEGEGGGLLGSPKIFWGGWRFFLILRSESPYRGLAK